MLIEVYWTNRDGILTALLARVLEATNSGSWKLDSGHIFDPYELTIKLKGKIVGRNAEYIRPLPNH
jgi:hypothetical protein|tara:strand:+ start:264 stop:461 length:198 start_codon:yes stop_codon:yes gene_type:complete